MSQIDRIRYMETLFDEVRPVIERMQETLDEYDAVQDKIDLLAGYMSGGSWLRDFEDDAAGRVPADVKRGVLSEDGLYDTLSQDAEVLRRMKEITDARAVPEEEES